MIPPDALNDVAHAIQLALAPVFLLTGIAGLLNVMAGRLSRIIDRGRYLTEHWGRLVESAPDATRREQEMLETRRHFTSIAVTACTIAALLICVVIATLFIEVMLGVRLNWVVGALFTGAMLALVIGLAFFLREVHLAMQSIRIPTPGAKQGA